MPAPPSRLAHRAQAAPAQRPDGHRQRFGQCRLIVGHRVRDREAHARRRVAQFREPAIAMQAKRLQGRAAGHLSTLAQMAAAARDDRVNCDPLTRQRPRYASTDSHYHAGEFVPQDERCPRSGERVRNGRQDEHRPSP
jgi:hypothetical protein